MEAKASEKTIKENNETITGSESHLCQALS